MPLWDEAEDKRLRALSGVQSDGATGNCGTCKFNKAVSNGAFKGIKIPGSYGKCIRPGGLCRPDPIPKLGITGLPKGQ